MPYTLCQICNTNATISEPATGKPLCPTCGNETGVLGTALLGNDGPEASADETYARGIYQELDTLTGGIEAFIAHQGDDSFTSDTWEPFGVTCLPDRRIWFGFFAEYNGDLCPDPWIFVTLEDSAARLEDLEVQTMFDLTRGDPRQGGKGGEAEYAYELLQEVNNRKQRGYLTHRHTEYS